MPSLWRADVNLHYDVQTSIFIMTCRRQSSLWRADVNLHYDVQTSIFTMTCRRQSYRICTRTMFRNEAVLSGQEFCRNFAPFWIPSQPNSVYHKNVHLPAAVVTTPRYMPCLMPRQRPQLCHDSILVQFRCSSLVIESIISDRKFQAWELSISSSFVYIQNSEHNLRCGYTMLCLDQTKKLKVVSISLHKSIACILIYYLSTAVVADFTTEIVRYDFLSLGRCPHSIR